MIVDKSADSSNFRMVVGANNTLEPAGVGYGVVINEPNNITGSEIDTDIARDRQISDRTIRNLDDTAPFLEQCHRAVIRRPVDNNHFEIAVPLLAQGLECLAQHRATIDSADYD